MSFMINDGVITILLKFKCHFAKNINDINSYEK